MYRHLAIFLDFLKFCFSKLGIFLKKNIIIVFNTTISNFFAIMWNVAYKKEEEGCFSMNLKKFTQSFKSLYMVGQRYIPMLILQYIRYISIFQLPNSTQGRAPTPFCGNWQLFYNGYEVIALGKVKKCLVHLNHWNFS
jgi:hypothetical protein